MKTILSLLAILLCCSEVQAQNVEGQIIAAQYGEFKVASQNTGSFQFPSATCQVSGGGKNFEAFAAGRAVKIVDSNPNLTEVSTPSSAFQDPCVINMTTSFTHVPPYYLTSGTGGLQEAITANQQGIAGANSVILNSEWYSLIKPRTAATVIGSVQGNINMPLIDITTAPYNYYTWNGSHYALVPNAAGQFLPLTGGTISGALFGPNINGEVYPAACGRSPLPSWCSGTTADAWIRAACTQLPSAGGVINFLGLTGNFAASAPCSTPTKQVIMLADNTSRIDITETDGLIALPQDDGSMILGQGAGQCKFTSGGIHLASGANVTAIAGPAHTDGTQEAFTASGLCLFGATGATVSQGLLYAEEVFTNTTLNDNNIQVCDTACLKLVNVSDAIALNNELNVTDGDNLVTASGLIIQAKGPGTGCLVNRLHISGSSEHANGGGPDILVEGDGAGALACDVWIDHMHTERGSAGTPSTNSIVISDCLNCTLTNVNGGGGSAGSEALVLVQQTAANRTQNVLLSNISNVFDTYPQTLNDTITPRTLSFSSVPQISTYYVVPGYQQPPVLPGSVLQSVGADLMSGDGNFASGSGTIGTNFNTSGCNDTITCVYTRTNSTAPPGSTFSQQIQITANADPSGGFNGVSYGPSISFTAGQQYVASFWGKGDGTFAGLPTFLLWDSTVPTFYCQGTSDTPFTTTWTLYSFSCTPSVSGSGASRLNISALTPVGQTGTFWFGGFTFSPVTPLTPGNLLTSVTPYGIGPASDAQKTISINSTPCELGGSCSVGGASSPFTITPSGSPVINMANGPLQTITLTSDATATISGITAGNRLAMQICQGGTVFAWTWPASIHGGICVGPSCTPYPTQPNTCSMQTFNSYTGTTLVPENIGVINVAP